MTLKSQYHAKTQPSPEYRCMEHDQPERDAEWWAGDRMHRLRQASRSHEAKGLRTLQVDEMHLTIRVAPQKPPSDMQQPKELKSQRHKPKRL